MDFVWFTAGLCLSLWSVSRLGPHIHSFSWGRYGVIVGVCLLWVTVVAYMVDERIIAIYVASCIAGAFVEFVFGRIWHLAMGHRLWEYWRYTLGGYTSLLVIPLWGVAGVFFFLLNRLIAGI